VAAYEFIDVCSEESGRKFQLGRQSEAIDFLSWLLNALHKGLGGTKKKNSSIINQCFQVGVLIDLVT
jgi:U4/U6.U5 tri-snRNP-associated protein 2